MPPGFWTPKSAAKQNPRYDGTWRPEAGKTLPEVPAGVEPVIRIKAPTSGTIEFEDGVKGSMKFDANQVDDFVIVELEPVAALLSVI